MIGGHQIVQALCRIRWGRSGRGCCFWWRLLSNLLANETEAIAVVARHIVRHAAHRRVHPRPAQRLRVHNLTDRALHQVRTAQPHEADAVHHYNHVAESWQISASGNAWPHHRRDLRHMQNTPHQRVVVENARGPVLAWKDAVLQRQVHTGRIHQIDDGQPVAHRDLLNAEDLGDRLRPPRPRLHRGIVGHDHRRPALNLRQSGYHARARRLTIVLVVGDEQADLEEHRAGVDQPRDALASGKLSVAVLLLDLLRTAAGTQLFFERVQLVDELAHASGGQLSRHLREIPPPCAPTSITTAMTMNTRLIPASGM